MHVGEPGGEEFPATVDHPRAVWHMNVTADCRDDALVDQHRLVGEHAVPIHRHHGHVNERGNFGLGREAVRGKSQAGSEGERSGDHRWETDRHFAALQL
jgi:hypothetical protein